MEECAGLEKKTSEDQCRNGEDYFFRWAKRKLDCWMLHALRWFKLLKTGALDDGKAMDGQLRQTLNIIFTERKHG